MKDLIKKISSFVLAFVKKELKDKKRLFFWGPFLLLIIVCLILFIIYRVSIIGWLLSIILFILCFIFRLKIFIFAFKIQIIIAVSILIIFSIIFIFTKGNSYVDNSNSVSKTPLKELTYGKEYNIIDDMGTYEVKLSTNKEENRYELELYIQTNTSIIPSGFIWDSTKCDTYIREHITVYKLDQLEVFITSSDKKNKYYSHGPVSLQVDYTSGSGKINGMFPTRFLMTFNNSKSLKDFINKYNKLEFYRYNIGEVGIRDFKSEKSDIGDGYIGSYGYNSERSYKLHKVILETDIIWGDLETDLGL